MSVQEVLFKIYSCRNHLCVITLEIVIVLYKNILRPPSVFWMVFATFTREMPWIQSWKQKEEVFLETTFRPQASQKTAMLLSIECWVEKKETSHVKG